VASGNRQEPLICAKEPGISREEPPKYCPKAGDKQENNRRDKLSDTHATSAPLWIEGVGMTERA